MDSLQTKALSALEPYILLSKSANSPRAAADLVTQATSAPNTFVFAELLNTPNIQALSTASSDYASHFSLLQIFAWGTWEDYSTQQANLPKLTPAQAQKLRQLTLLTLCQTPQYLTYPHLLSALSLPDSRALEDLAISAIYAGLMTAHLNPLAQRIDVSSVAPVRDLKPDSVPQMISVLANWDSRCVGVLKEIEGQVKTIRRNAIEKRKKDEAIEKQTRELIGNEKGNKGRGGGGKRGGADDDVDMNEGGAKGRRVAKRGGVSGGVFAGLGKRLGGGN